MSKFHGQSAIKGTFSRNRLTPGAYQYYTTSADSDTNAQSEEPPVDLQPEFFMKSLSAVTASWTAPTAGLPPDSTSGPPPTVGNRRKKLIFKKPTKKSVMASPLSESTPVSIAEISPPPVSRFYLPERFPNLSLSAPATSVAPPSASVGSARESQSFSSYNYEDSSSSSSDGVRPFSTERIRLPRSNRLSPIVLPPPWRIITPAEITKVTFCSTPRPAHVNVVRDSGVLDMSRASCDMMFFQHQEPLDLSYSSGKSRIWDSEEDLYQKMSKACRVILCSSSDSGMSESSPPQSTSKKNTNLSNGEPQSLYLESDEGFDFRLESPAVCPHCHLVFHKSLHAFEMHLYRHTKERNYYCYRCPTATFPSAFCLKKHQRLPHSLKGFRDFESYECGVCQIAFQTMDEFDFHLEGCLISSPKRKPSKQGVGKKEKNERTKKSRPHPKGKDSKRRVKSKRQKATSPSVKTCHLCHITLKSHNAFVRHMGQKHEGGEIGLSCPECKKGFSSQYNLSIHRRIHSGLKPYVCPDCSESFRIKCSLNNHMMKVHGISNEKSGQENAAHVSGPGMSPMKRGSPTRNMEKNAVSDSGLPGGVLKENIYKNNCM